MPHQRPSLLETLGLLPPGEALRAALVGLRGDAHTPRTRFGPSSLGILQPRLALILWSGRRGAGRRVPLYNLFSHVRPDPTRGWSVEKTMARDFRGRQHTYDSHNGTDFGVPPGTTVVAAAAGRVVRVSREFDRGGLKVMLDHGEGLFTVSAHLARALVREGDVVARAEPVALSGMSGLDGVAAFPWNAPHVHFNVWLDGEAVDPFARQGEVALWRTDNAPVPAPIAELDDRHPAPEFTAFDADAVARGIAACRAPALRATLDALREPWRRGAHLLFHQLYYPSRFSERPRLVATTRTVDGASAPGEGRRAPRLDLPFSAEDFDGVVFPPGA